MTVYIEKETDDLKDFDFKTLFERVVSASAEHVGIPFDVSVNVLLTDDVAIHEINLSERNIDRPTDVLSFPALEFERAGDFSGVSTDDVWLFDQESGELLLGDIVISLDTAKRQASEYGHSLEREIAFLLAHSMLHLSGYDHIEDGEREEMEAMQREILNGLGITR